ncbi:3TM-type holin [Pararhizobium haloflavum]|uniref:3TM-type holin n=1 Tax=Pararhizobium haloflavum TaxID=2037914 RepID=UPI001300005A|nr:3TM-type holin [Pararhizobium haloflavum]
MSPVLASMLIEVAAKVGAPIVRQLLETRVGGMAGEMGGMIIDTIAKKAGVAPDDLPSLPAEDLEIAVAAAEAETPQLVAAWVEQQREANRLMLAELGRSESWWTWAWRPAWMWFLGFLFLFRLVLVPTLDAAIGSDIAADIDLSTMMTLTAWFMGLYMGGHTVKQALNQFAGRG